MLPINHRPLLYFLNITFFLCAQATTELSVQGRFLEPQSAAAAQPAPTEKIYHANDIQPSADHPSPTHEASGIPLHDTGVTQPSQQTEKQPTAIPDTDLAATASAQPLPQDQTQNQALNQVNHTPAQNAATTPQTLQHPSVNETISDTTNQHTPAAATPTTQDDILPIAQQPQNASVAQPATPNAPAAPHSAKLTPPQNQDLSPWEQFLIYTISLLRMAQNAIEHYFSVLLSKQGIPLLIITFGVLLLNIVIWFAYVSFKKEQSVKIKNLVRNKSTHKPVSSGPAPLALAYAEESSGDFDVFATSEGIPIKLDLAQAYINMGDKEGAKEILTDIIEQHRGKVVSMAQSLLKKIDSTQ